MTERLDGAVEADLDRAAMLLRAGQLVAFPTETVYGLGADGLDGAAAARIFEAKGRPADNPLILHVATFEAALALWRPSAQEAARARSLADAFWPGPLTLVLPAVAGVPGVVRAGLDTVAVRMPDHPLALALIERVDRPLAAPSANRSGRPSPTTADHVLRTLDGRIAAVLDGGPTRVGVESTVADLRDGRVAILREGAITRAMLEDVIGVLDAPAAGAGEAARAPGMRHRHYAPEGLVTRLADDAALAAAWASDAAILCRSATAARLGTRGAPTEVLPDDAERFARGLYAALHRLERCGAQELLIEAAPAGQEWAAVRDRTVRAAAG
ncbi:MAG: L-threonylcarbamoyladenylate synthase [Pseudomonadales bacterium]|nr:L-threonylcarbamoyladenylate synthase [Pseudomonadales bacterium]